MVRYKGVNVHVVSEVGARRLPEYSTAQAFDKTSNGSIVACYIPLYSGAQIWFDYSIDGPHPSEAMYLFKLFMNGENITNWDSTSKNEYSGRAFCSLHTIKSGRYGQRSTWQNCFRFSTEIDKLSSPATKDDCLEIRIHRVQQRRRLRQVQPDPEISNHLQQGNGAFRISGGGLIELGRPARKYQYLLLDPQDEPYAIFRFYCRTQAYLERHQIIDADGSLSSASYTNSESDYFDADSSPQHISLSESFMHARLNITPTRSSTGSRTMASLSPTRNISTKQHQALPRISNHRRSPAQAHNAVYLQRSPLSPPNIKDSIEDLPSTLARSSPTISSGSPLPRYASLKNRLSNHFKDATLQRPLSPSQASSPLMPEGLQVYKKPLVELEIPVSVPAPPPRPLSPFTSGGLLRRLTSTRSVSAPAAVTEAGPTLQDEVDEAMGKLSTSDGEDSKGARTDGGATQGTTRAQRGGQTLMRLLRRRVGRHETAGKGGFRSGEP